MSNPDRKLRLTKTAIRSIPRPESGYVIAMDMTTPGLGVRVTAAGARSFVYERRINGKSRRMTLGSAKSISVETARKQAAKLAGKIADGRDPVADRRREKAEGVSLKTAVEAYLRARHLKPRTRSDVEAAMRSLDDWMDRPVKAITGAMVERRHRELGERSPARANLTMRYLRAILNYAAHKWATDDGSPLIVFNPVVRLSQTRAWHRIEPRRVALKPHEIKPLWDTLDELASDPAYPHGFLYASYFRTLLLTGLRRTEALKLEWRDVDLIERTLTVRDPKNRKPLTLPIPNYLATLFAECQESGYGKRVFSDKSGEGIGVNLRFAIPYIEKRTGLHVRPHDLRRTFATIATELNVPTSAVSALLNHTPATVTEKYIVSNAESLRAPMQKIEDRVLYLAGMREPARVVALTHSRK